MALPLSTPPLPPDYRPPLFAALGLVLASLCFALYIYSRTATPQPIKLSTVPDTDTCEYGPAPLPVYLSLYTVVPGDTLLSIANHQLGSTRRVGEIITLNRNRASLNALYTSTQIEEGTQLLLPSPQLPESSGDLVASLGRLRLDTQTSGIGRPLIVSDPYNFPTGTPIAFGLKSRFFGAESFTSGDCLLVIRDEGYDYDLVVAKPNGLHTLEPPALTPTQVEFPQEPYACQYDALGAEEILTYYTVAPGDSLTSIAVTQLNDSNRVAELKQINKDRYPSLKSDNFIEVGWQLLLPPAWTGPTSGHFHGFAGTLIRQEANQIWVGRTTTDRAQLSFSTPPGVKFFGRRVFNPGDCVVILSDLSTTLAIVPQELDYLSLFRDSHASAVVSSPSPSPVNSFVVTLEAADTGEAGTATFTAQGNQTLIELDIDNVPGSGQPVYLYHGNCDFPGQIAHTLTPLSNDLHTNLAPGNSETVLDVSLTQLISEHPLALAIHYSPSISSFASCVNVTWPHP